MSEINGYTPERPSQKESSVFHGSEFIAMRERQESIGMPFSVIHTDIDNSFFRKDRSEESRKLAVMVYEANIPLHAVTGNSFEDVLKRIESGELPYFQVISGKVGTERYVLHIDAEGKQTYVRDEDYERELAAKNFDRRSLVESSNELMRKTDKTWRLDFQKPEEEAQILKGEKVTDQPYKLSFYFFASSLQQMDQVLETMRQQYPNQRVVVCEEIGYNSKLQPGDPRKKYCLDLLPITKAEAVNNLAELTGSKVNIVVGDSGNDNDMLLGAGNVSILVGGATPDAKNAIENAITEFNASKGKPNIGRFEQIGQKWYFREDPLEKVKRRLKVLSGGETSSYLGPDSIIHTLKVLVRAARMKLNGISQAYSIQNPQAAQTEINRMMGILNAETYSKEAKKEIYV